VRVAYLNQDRGIGPGRRKGAAVHVESMQEAFRALGCEVLALEAKSEEAARAALEAAHAQAPLDLLYERYALGASAGGAFARARGVPHVLEVNAPLLEEEARHRGGTLDAATRAREARLLAAPARVFAVSREVADWVVAQGVPSERVCVHANAVDAQRFRPRDDERVRESLAIAPETFVVGFHGRLRPWHGFERIARAVRALVDEGLGVRVLTVGEGEYAQALAAAGLDAHATCLPWLPHAEVARMVAAFDALPLAYGSDAPFYFSPLKLLEAMACGVAPVVPDLGELPRLVEHGRAGLVYRAGAVDELTRALALLARDGALRARLGARAVEVAAGHSWVAIARAALDAAGSAAR
jgi:glycosyltransferase involved in cell wall biosynthesis